jgi:hypothetical protein
MKAKRAIFHSLALGWTLFKAKMDLGTFSAHAQIMPSHYRLISSSLLQAVMEIPYN